MSLALTDEDKYVYLFAVLLTGISNRLCKLTLPGGKRLKDRTEEILPPARLRPRVSEGSSGGPDLHTGLAPGTFCLKLRKHLRDGRENRPHHPQALWAVSRSSIASGTRRRRVISPVALQHLARSRLLSPVLRAQNLKKKKKASGRQAPEPPPWWQLAPEHQRSACAKAGPARPFSSRLGLGAVRSWSAVAWVPAH
ncbi:unnamed protein product [Rangifer tarandus platyrhynchus]|uniref:Uncharacterized protein n=1 Tax=Rangifer tarandus platyrhynchus TaxID=3082113 RepID=A0ABN8ZC11_RANTA|nr:unnamed protein product [Rangifer tarandus platyrhynchus]